VKNRNDARMEDFSLCLEMIVLARVQRRTGTRHMNTALGLYDHMVMNAIDGVKANRNPEKNFTSNLFLISAANMNIPAAPNKEIKMEKNNIASSWESPLRFVMEAIINTDPGEYENGYKAYTERGSMSIGA